MQDVAYPMDPSLNSYDMRDDADKFLFQFTPISDLRYYSNSYIIGGELCSYKAIYDELERNGIKLSFVIDKYAYYPLLTSGINQTDGTMAFYCLDSVVEDISDFIYENSKKAEIVDDVSKRTYISSLDLQNITLDKPLSIEDNEQWDTDEDGLTDWQEVLCKGGLITGNAADGFVLPTYEEYLKIAVSVEELEGIEDYLRNKLDSSSYQYVKNIKVLPLISDPTIEDTDGDNLSDGEEYEYILYDGVTFENMGLLINTKPLCVDTDRDGINDYLLERTILDVNFTFATDQEQNYDMGSIVGAYGSYRLPDTDYAAEYVDNALTYLIRQQGHKVTEVYQRLFDNPEGWVITGNFIDSVVNEIVNNSSESMSELCILVKMNAKEYLTMYAALKAKKPFNLKFSKDSTVGIFNEWAGCGSLFGIELEKDFIVPSGYIREITLDDAAGKYTYSVGRTYGMSADAWQDTVSYTEETGELMEEDLIDISKFFDQMPVAAESQ